MYMQIKILRKVKLKIYVFCESSIIELIFFSAFCAKYMSIYKEIIFSLVTFWLVVFLWLIWVNIWRTQTDSYVVSFTSQTNGVRMAYFKSSSNIGW